MSINKIDYADLTDVLSANLQKPFELDSYTTLTIPKLVPGRVDEIGASLYRVENTDETPSGSPSDGIVYLYVEDPGTGVAVATLSATVPTWFPSLGGYYNGNAKAVFFCTKSGTNYLRKARLVDLEEELFRHRQIAYAIIL